MTGGHLERGARHFCDRSVPKKASGIALKQHEQPRAGVALPIAHHTMGGRCIDRVVEDFSGGVLGRLGD